MTDPPVHYNIAGLSRGDAPASRGEGCTSSHSASLAEPKSHSGRYPIERGKKELILRLIQERLAADLAVFTDAAKTAHEASIHEENVPDNKYDTLSLEASYIAQGQANRAQEIKLALHAYQTLILRHFSTDAAIRLTALVTLEAEDGTARAIFIGPAEGGLKLSCGEDEIVVITPGSPLGRALIGKHVGDEVQMGVAGQAKAFEIIQVY